MQVIPRVRAHAIALACALWALPSLVTAQASVVAFTGATVIDGTGAPPFPNATVVIEGDRIACVGECDVPPTAEVIDASGRYIIPGLVDAHVHYELSGWVDALPGIFGTDVQDRFPYPEVLADLRERPERFHRSYLCSGVTAVFNTGGYPWTLAWREEAEHSPATPHIASAGPLLTSLARVVNHPAATGFSVQMTDEETVRSAVRRLAELGSNAVKVHRPDLIQDPERRRALLSAAGEEARRQGMRLIALPQTLAAAKDALRAGASLFVYPVEDALVDEEFLELARPFDAQPGEQWVYGYATDILGAVVERVSGQTLDTFLQSRILGPLDMKDTHFYLPEAKRDRLAVVYSATDAGGIERAPDPGGTVGQGAYADGPRKSYSGGAGLLSTAADYARFLQMLLNGGELDGTRILSPKTVQLMTVDHLGRVEYQPGQGFGLGFYVVEDLGARGVAGSVGEFGWGGAYHSTHWVDPEEELVVVYFTQLIPARGLDDQGKLRALIYQALVN